MAKFDLQKTSLLLKLLKTPNEQRNNDWLNQFIPTVMDASLASHEPQVIQGPDGFAYFGLKTPPIKQEYQANCISHILEHCTNAGLGVVLNPTEKSADWVFTYGNMWSLRQYGNPFGNPNEETTQGVETHVVGSDEKVFIAQPSQDFLPDYARNILREVLKQLGISQPECMLMTNPKMQPVQNIIFNVFRDRFQEEKDFQNFGYRFRWFLPPKMGLVFIDSNSDIMKHFQPL